MSKAKLRKVARANAEGKEPPMPMLGKGKSTKFTGKSAAVIVRTVKRRAKP